MKNRTSIWLAIGLVAAALPALAGQQRHGGPFAGPGGPGGPDQEMLGERLEMRAERLAEALDLTAEQRTAFTQLREDAVAAAEPVVERMREAGEELRGLLDGGSADEAAVGALVLEMHRLRGELRSNRENVESGLEALLTDAQRLALDAVRETRPRPRRFGGPGGDRPGPGGPPPAWLGGSGN